MSFSYVGGDVTAGRAAGVTAGRGDLTETEEGETAAGRGGDPTRGNEDSQDVSESPFANLGRSYIYFSRTRSVELCGMEMHLHVSQISVLVFHRLWRGW
jgi:hypothetical protein